MWQMTKPNEKGISETLRRSSVNPHPNSRHSWWGLSSGWIADGRLADYIYSLLERQALNSLLVPSNMFSFHF